MKGKTGKNYLSGGDVKQVKGIADKAVKGHEKSMHAKGFAKGGKTNANMKKMGIAAGGLAGRRTGPDRSWWRWLGARAADGTGCAQAWAAREPRVAMPQPYGLTRMGAGP